MCKHKRMKKLNVLLAITDQLRSKQKAMIKDYSKFFSNKQGSFIGERKTFEARDGYLDDPTKRSFVRVVTTVDEKLDYLVKQSKEFINALFSQEKTNASGVAKAPLIVEGVNWGEFTSLELLRLKTMLESEDYGHIVTMLGAIPVRTEGEVWIECKDGENLERRIYETEMFKGETKTTEKEQYVLEDPNVKHLKDTAGYQSPVGVKSKMVVTGDYTNQNFSGEWTHAQKAAAINRRTTLLTAVVEALKTSNDVDALKSDLTAEKIFEFIFKGENS